LQYLEREDGGGDGGERRRGVRRADRGGKRTREGGGGGGRKWRGRGDSERRKIKRFQLYTLALPSIKREDGKREGKKVLRLGGRLG